MSQSVESVEIVVVGSANVDLVVSMDTLPRPGETLSALASRTLPGGKGGNQAVAAARLGRTVAFVGCVGDDGGGQLMRTAFAAEGIALDGLATLADTPTGQALVVVEAAGENFIIVIPGANGAVSPQVVRDAGAMVASAAVVVGQLEIPLDAVREAAATCTGTFVLNAAPAAPLPAELLALVDVLVVNEHEYAVVLGGDPAAAHTEMVGTLTAPGVPSCVVITLGARGALVWADGELTQVSAPKVDVVDTTGAGDTLVGALADALSRGVDLVAATRWAVAAASLSTQALGATSGMPTYEQVKTLYDAL